MDDVRGRFLGLPHGTTPAAVTKNKNIKMSSFKSSENIQKKEGGSDMTRNLLYLFMILYNKNTALDNINKDLLKLNIFVSMCSAV